MKKRDDPTTEPVASKSRGLARNTAIFSIATGLSRVAGMGREVLASSYFGTSGPFSAFTIAFQIPNLIRSLVADAAISAAFVPVFTELLEKGKKREAAQLATTLSLVIFLLLGVITTGFVFAMPVLAPLFVGDGFTPELKHLTVGLSQLLFPIVVLLGLNGLVVGILNSYEHFALPAFAPVIWNLLIVISLVAFRPLFSEGHQIYALAVGVLIGTVVQLVMVLPMLSRVGFHFSRSINLRDPRLKSVFILMLPVTIGLGVINFDLVINSVIGSLISDSAPRAIDAAFRIYMLPQGLFSVALATVLFPTLSRYAARKDFDGLRGTLATGMRQIMLLLLPAAAVTLVLSEPITRLVYERGAFGADSTDEVALALFWFSFSLPFAGLNLLLTRTFFSLKCPWIPTAMAALNLTLNTAVSFALYGPLDIAGPVIGTVVGSVGMAFAQAWYLRRELGSLEGSATAVAGLKMLFASAVAGAMSWFVWFVLDDLCGRGLIGQLVSIGAALTVAVGFYSALLSAFKVSEYQQVLRLLKRGRGAGKIDGSAR